MKIHVLTISLILLHIKGVAASRDVKAALMGK